MRIDKLDAARRQLNEAIKMFFRKGDPVCVHTLAGAADNIITDLAIFRGVRLGVDRLNDESVSVGIVTENMISDAKRALRKPRNFFKHADNDPNGFFEFNPDVNESFLFFICEHFTELSPELGPINVYRSWFLLKNSAIWRKSPSAKVIIEKYEFAGVSSDDFDVFLGLCDVDN